MNTKKVLFGVGIGVAFLLIAVCIASWLFFGDSETFYTQIDNTRIERVTARRGGMIDLIGGLEYRYSLPAYSDKGGLRNVSFGAPRELRNGAFLKLTVIPLRGVTKWEEVQYHELPPLVQNRYPAPR